MKVNIKKLIAFALVLGAFSTVFAMVIVPNFFTILLSSIVSYFATNMIINVIWKKKVINKER